MFAGKVVTSLMSVSLVETVILFLGAWLRGGRWAPVATSDAVQGPRAGTLGHTADAGSAM